MATVRLRTPHSPCASGRIVFGHTAAPSIRHLPVSVRSSAVISAAHYTEPKDAKNRIERSAIVVMLGRACGGVGWDARVDTGRECLDRSSRLTAPPAAALMLARADDAQSRAQVIRQGPRTPEKPSQTGGTPWLSARWPLVRTTVTVRHRRRHAETLLPRLRPARKPARGGARRSRCRGIRV